MRNLLRNLLIVLLPAVAFSAACLAKLYFDLRSDTDPSWIDCFYWGVLLLGPVSFATGAVMGGMILAAIAFAEYVMNHSPGSHQ